nr:protein 109 [synthetic construct]
MAAEIKARGYTYNEVVANLDPLLHGRLEGTMQGWYAPANYVGSTMIAHWITFLVLSACTMYLARDSFANRGPRGNTAYYSGYNEQYNIALYVNLMACVAYYGKVVADTSNHNFSNVGPFIPGLGNYRYADYMLTCPLLVMDLLFQLRAPFKITSAFLIFVVLLCGVVTDFYPPDVLYGPSVAWFIFGCFWYIIAYIFLYTIITKQYKRLLEISKETEAKKSLGPLKLAIYTFFSIWLIFPCVWLLTPKGLNMLDEDSAEVLFCICDLLAKSMYGFALSRFRFYYDKKMYDLFEQLGYDPENIEEEMQKELKL